MAAVVAMSTKHAAAKQNTAYFDTDSMPIGIDNRCSACISHDIRDFVGTLQECNRTIKGFGGWKNLHSTNHGNSSCAEERASFHPSHTDG